jgi:hypothetical protein
MLKDEIKIKKLIKKHTKKQLGLIQVNLPNP